MIYIFEGLNRPVVTRNDPKCGMDASIRPCTNSAVATGFRGNGDLFNLWLSDEPFHLNSYINKRTKLVSATQPTTNDRTRNTHRFRGGGKEAVDTNTAYNH